MLEVLGQGGFGVVLKALDAKLNRTVAVKVLGSHLTSSGTARKRFVREARATAAVSNEHVIGIYAVDEEPVPHLVMEYIPGQTLQDKLDRNGPLELTEVLRIGWQIADGLAAAHAIGLIHRDIKPGNILLEEGVERVKITDFGLARAADDASLTQSGAIVGTPMFMAPEQALDQPIDHRADLFSLGSVLYVMCTGHPPFRAPNTLSILKRVCEDTPRPIREVNADIPDWLAAIVGKLMEKEPAARFQTAAEVADLFKRHLARMRTDSPPPPLPQNAGAKAPPRAKKSRRWVAVVGLTVALLAVAGLLALLLWPDASGKQTGAVVAPPRQDPIARQRQSAEDLLKKNQPDAALAALRQGLADLDRAAVSEAERITLRADFQRLRAEAFRLQNKPKEADDELRQAHGALEKLAAERPEDENVAASLANVMLAEHEAAQWTVLRPASMKSEGGARLTRQLDDSILASGTNASADAYTVTFDRVAQPVAAVRLEALTHSSLPKNGPGRHDSGNFQLAEITLHDTPPDPKAKPTPLPIAKARASYHWTGQQIERAFDNNPSTVWHVWSRTGQNHWAVFTPAQPITLPAGNRLVVRLQHLAYQPGINLGRFRVSVTTRSDPARDDNLLQLARGVSGWRRVAAVHVLRQEWQQAQEALARATAPETLNGPDHLLLALVHKQQGHPAEAAQHLDRAVAWAVADSPGDAFLNVAFEMVAPGLAEERKDPAWFQLRARWHSKNQRSADAGRDLSRALERNPALALGSEDAASLNGLAQGAAERGQWQDVKGALLRLIEIDARNSWEWHRTGVVLAHLDEAAYRSHRTALLERFGTTQDPVVAERIAKFGLLLPAEGDTLKQLAGLADLAVTKGEGQSVLPYAQMSRGLVEYRQENYGAAESWLRQALLTPNIGWPVKVSAELVLAMAQQKRGQRNEARASLRRAVAQMEKDLPQPASPAVGTSWPDWLVCQVLRREAELLIEGK